MSWSNIAALADLISAVAVLVTLAFLVQQIRQNTKALKAQSMYAANDAFNSINLIVGNSPDQARIYLECTMDYDSAAQETQV